MAELRTATSGSGPYSAARPVYANRISSARSAGKVASRNQPRIRDPVAAS